MTKVNINLRKSLLSEEFIKQARLFMVQWKNTGGTKNIKKTAFYRCQCFAPVATALPPLSSRPVASPKGQKPLAFGETHNPSTTPKYASHGRDVILHVRHKW